MKKLIFNPFVRIAGLQALGLGVLMMLAGSLLAALCDARFDGVLDLHFYKSRNFMKPFTDQLLVWISLVAVFYPIGLISGAKPRFIDIAGTFALARAPFVIAPLFNITGFMSGLAPRFEQAAKDHLELSFTTAEIISLIVLVCLSLLLVVWMVILYLNAYKTSTNLKESRLVLGFISGLVLSEILSVYLIRILFNY